MRAILKETGRYLALVAAYLVLYIAGSRFLGPDLSSLPAAPANEGQVLAALLAVALVDTAILMAVIRASRLTGWPLMLLVAFVFYGVKTFTSGIEAWYFMTNITLAMLPGLFRMTVPLAILFPPIAVWACGRVSSDPSDSGPAWQLPARSPFDLTVRIAVLAAIVYPVLFLLFGYFVAWQFPQVRAFYGNPGAAQDFLHQVMTALPAYPLEAMRGLLWVAFAVPVLATTRGRWWVGALLVALAFALIQNDVHLIPNPLMPPMVRLAHFIETASSNFIWAWAIGFVLARPRANQPASPDRGDFLGQATVR